MNYLLLRHFVFALFSCSILLSTACSDKTKIPAPDVIRFTKPALYPEGVEYDPKGKQFLVSSLHEGIIGSVKDDGSFKVLIKDTLLVSTIGIRIDHTSDRLLVCNSDPGASLYTNKMTQGKLAGLGIYTLSTGQLIKYIDLGAMAPGGHFCNDIALDKAGNAYVSDSFSPIIYKIDKTNSASILLNNKRFAGKGFNLNGLVVKDDYLLIAKSNEGILFKVPLHAPEKFTQVKIDQTMRGADGLLWASDGSLIVISDTSGKVFKLSSMDNWASARISNSSEAGPVFPTTGVLRDGSVYVLNARLNVLFNPETKTHIETFEIHKHKL